MHSTSARLLIVFAAILGLLVNSSRVALAQGTDTRWQAWVGLYQAGKFADLAQQAERDLNGESPHPRAGRVWLEAQRALGKTPGPAAAQLAGKARSSVSALAEIYQADLDDKLRDMLEQFPLSAGQSLGVPELTWLADIAVDAYRPQLAFDYLTLAAQRTPDDMYIVWGAVRAWLSDNAARADLENARNKLVPLLEHDHADLLRRLLVVPKPTEADQASLLDEWMARHPADVDAMHYWAAMLTGLKHDVAADQAMVNLSKANPFRYPVTSHSIVLVRLNRIGDAQKALEQRARVRVAGQQHEQRVAELMISALIDGGESVAASKALLAARQRWPQDLQFVRQQGSLEFSNRRWRKEIEALRVILNQQPSDLRAYSALMYAFSELKDGEAALLARKAFIAAGGRETASSVNTAMLAALEAGRVQEALDIAQPWHAEHPHEFYLSGNIAVALKQLGRTEESLAAFRDLFSWHAPSTYYASKYISVLEDSNADVERELTQLRAAWPRDYAVWAATETWLATRDPDKALRRELWSNAVSTAPDIGDYWVQRSYIEDDDAQAQALKQVESGRAAIASALPTQRGNWLHYRVYGTAAALEGHKVEANAELLESLFKDLEELKQLRQPLTNYYHGRQRLFALQGLKDEAQAEAIAWASADPSDMTAISTLIKADAPRREGFGRLARILDRKPYDADTLSDAALYHARYGGNPLAVLRIQQLADEVEVLPATDRNTIASCVSDVYGKFGDGKRKYRESYRGASSISASDRYVHWFDYARNNARQISSTLKSTDLESSTVTVVSPDGIEISAKWDPIVAQMTYYKVGAAWISAAYEGPSGEFSRARDSAGNDVRLEYNPKGQITRILSSDGGELLISGYDKDGKAARYVIPKRGSLDVTYKSDGSIDKFHSEGGGDVALGIQQIMGKVLDLTTAFGRTSFSDPPELPFADKTLDRLVNAQENAKTLADRIRTRLALSQYLIDHLADRRSYAADAEESTSAAWADAQREKDPALQAAAIDAMTAWHALQLRLRPDGVPPDQWQTWNEMLTWAARTRPLNAVAAGKMTSLQTEIRNHPLKLLAGHEWLPQSYIDIEGYWRRTALEAIVPRSQVGRVALQAAFVRANGELFVGTNRGLLVRKSGFWRWYGFDEVRSVWTAGPNPEILKQTSDISTIAEDSEGHLWLGTAGGLIALPGADIAQKASWLTQGLPVPRVAALAPWRDGVLVGTARGLRLFNINGDQRLPPALNAWSSLDVGLLRSFRGKAARALISGSGGSALLNGEQLISLSKDRLVDGLVLSEEDRCLLLYSDRLEERGFAPNSEPRRISGTAQLSQTKQVYGLGLVPSDDGVLIPTVLNDTGLVFYRGNHFETKKLPFSDHIAGAQFLASSHGRTLVLSDASIFELEKDHVAIDHRGPVLDLLVDEDQGLTFISRGSRLDVLRREAALAGAKVFARISSERLARDKAGRLITNDAETIVRFEPGSTVPQELFTVKPASSKGDSQFNHLTSLLVASDGSIWATYGASLFHWREGDTQAEEYSTYKDPLRFPGRTDAVSRVLETVDGRIWVVDSNESHLSEMGERLSGGLLEFNGNGFREVKEMSEARWFISSYTALGDGSAIVGTNAGFARHRGSLYVSIEATAEPSYLDLKRRNPMLFLGTRGTKIASEDSSAAPVWLFGTAGGIVAYQSGRWFVPDRLNWMLPDQHLADYGSRFVHAIATDRDGHIFAGTDGGLLVYDSGGGDPVDFLTSSGLTDLAFGETEQEKQRAQSQVLLGAVSAQSEMGKKQARYYELQGQIARLRERSIASAKILPLDGDSKSRPPLEEAADRAASVREQLAKAERANDALLQELERDPLLRSELRLEPLDLVALRRQLATDEVVVQFLPGTDQLNINVVRSSGTVVKEVNISRKELYDRVSLVSAALSGNTSVDPAELLDHLHFLYDVLLGPVEGLLDGSHHVYVTGTGPLSYLPFGALARNTKPAVEYAVERWQIGYMPSLFLFDGLRRDPGGQDRALILANPDGTLDAAEQEARTLYSLRRQNADLKIGDQATLDALLQLGPDSGLIHFATHAKFEATDPARSYVLLANKTRLTAASIVSLHLNKTDLVVLSACETGVGGKDGMEFATIARAFGHAGVPSVLATLWKVNDRATGQIVQLFYKSYSGDTYAALAAAQRLMIKSGGTMASPTSWAGFIPIGRP